MRLPGLLDGYNARFALIPRILSTQSPISPLISTSSGSTLWSDVSMGVDVAVDLAREVNATVYEGLYER